MTVEEYIEELQDDIKEIKIIINYSNTYVKHQLSSAIEKKQDLLKWLEEYKMLKESLEDDLK